MRRNVSRGKIQQHRLSDEFHREGRAWPITRQLLILAISFAVALNTCVKIRAAQHRTQAQQHHASNSNPAAAFSHSSYITEPQKSSRRAFATIYATPHRSRRSDAGALRHFDWEQYLLNYPQLRDQGIDTKAAAARHYLALGRPQGWVARKQRIILRYTAGTGLINQHYSHIAALVIAQQLGAEIVLPPAMHRSSFEHTFSVFKGESSVRWAFAPLESLYDVASLMKYWKKEGIVIHRTPRIRQTPDLSQPQTAFPSYVYDGSPSSVPDFLAARVHNVFGQNLPATEVAARIRAAVLDTTQMALMVDPTLDVSTVAADLPCTFFMVAAIPSQQFVRKAARSLQWALPVQRLADKVIAGMSSQLGARKYNGVHLRIEKDAETWAHILGGRAVVEKLYHDAMKAAHFDSRSPLYIASALLTYEGGIEDLKQVVKTLMSKGLTSGAVYKEMFLTLEDTRPLHSEQKGLIDFLVLSSSAGFVGFGPSTYSFFLAEYRTLQGAEREQSVLVDGSKIGTDPLFHSAGVLRARAPETAPSSAAALIGGPLHDEGQPNAVQAKAAARQKGIQ